MPGVLSGVWVNQKYTVHAEYRENDELTDPSAAVFTKQAPNGTQTSILQASLTHDGVGLFSYESAETAEGTYVWEAKDSAGKAARDTMVVYVIAGLT